MLKILMSVLTIIVLLFILLFICFKFTSKETGSTSTYRVDKPKYCAALSKPECAVLGKTIFGLVMPFLSRPKSRYALHAIIIDSVPPVVI